MRTGPGNRDDFMYAARSLLSAIGKQERERYLEYKQRQYALFLLDEEASEYPSEILNGHLVDYGPPSSHVEIEVNNERTRRHSVTSQPVAQLIDNETEGIKYALPPLKNRFVDPLVVLSDDSAKPLSELDINFKKLLEQQQRIQASSLSVRLVLGNVFEQELREGITQNETGFAEKSKEESLSADQLRRQIEGAGRRAEQAAVRAGYLVLKNTI